MTTSPRHGTFVWHDLMTSDVPRAVAFYEGLFGWRTRAVDTRGDESYTMILAGDVPLGGFVDFAAEGVPAHWMPYVAVADVDAVLDRVAEHGGSVCVPTTPIPNVGRFAVVTDPQGAALSLLTHTAQDRPLPPSSLDLGHFCWDELLTHDMDGSNAFYGDVFGWTQRAVEMGDVGTYWMQNAGGGDHCGIMKVPCPDAYPRSCWMTYVSVADVDEATARAVELGGRVCVPPKDVPGVGRIVDLFDPTGAEFSLFMPPTGEA